MMAVKCLKAGQNGRLLDKDSRCVAFDPDDGGKKMARMCKGTARPVSKWELTTSVVRVLVVRPSDVLGEGFPAAAKSGHKSHNVALRLPQACCFPHAQPRLQFSFRASDSSLIPQA
jgi:hypothetical protein